MPVRSGSSAAIDCLNVIGTDSPAVGAVHVLMTPRPCSGEARANAPLTSRPVLVALGSATDSFASPALEVTVAVVPAVYSSATPGAKAPNWTGVPIVSASVGGTVPLTASSPPTSTVNVAFEVLPLASVATHVTTVWPILKLEPEAGSHVTVGFGSSLSVAVGGV